MNIFITVGTTPFDTLIKYCDEFISPSEYTIKGQVSHLCLYQVKNFEVFEYTDEIQKYYDWADIIISHAGAGSFYKLMEQGKKVIFVPNKELKDGHQNDICKFAEDNNYAFVLHNYNDLNELLGNISSYNFTKYIKGKNEISEYILTVI